MKRLPLLILILGLPVTLLWLVGVALSQPPQPQTVLTVNSGQHFLPPYPSDRDRFGFDSSVGEPLTNFDVAALHAGWYSDWGANLNPPHPDDLTYVQLIRFKAGSDPHDPALVTVSPGKETIARIVAAHPGSLWMMSNEPDSLYQGNPIYPDVYAQVYHEYYHYIKSLDPTALIANGGIVQPTPCRLTYLDIVWDTYYRVYSETWPVDVWNIHAFILREVYNSWGASTPPGVPTSCGIAYKIRDGDNIDIFRDNLIAFRRWMKDKGEQNKPLIISEYGVLWPEWLKDEDGVGFPPSRVSHFMTQTFDLFLNETYTDVGYPADDYRLVQAWAWYSLSDDSYYNGYLFRGDSGPISEMGETYAAYTAALPDTRYTDLTLNVVAPITTALESITPGEPYDATSVALPVWAYVGNLGKRPVTTTVPLVTYLQRPVTHYLTVPARYMADIRPILVATISLTHPARYELSDIRVAVDPANTVGDPRPWNNVVTVSLPSVVDARPDLAVELIGWDYRPDVLSITFSVTNIGIWPSPPVSGSLILSDARQSLLLPTDRFTVPSLLFAEAVTITRRLTVPVPGLYTIRVEADDDNQVDEPDEANNRIQTVADLRPDLQTEIGGWEARFSAAVSSTLHVTYTVSNYGVGHSVPTSVTQSLGEPGGTLLITVERASIPALAPGMTLTYVRVITLPPPDGDFYHLTIEADEADLVDESDEENNVAHLVVPILVTTTVMPDSAAVLTSTSGYLTLFIPTGTVTLPTILEFTPIWGSDLPPGLWRAAIAFHIAFYRAGQMVDCDLLNPITVTWRYTDSDVAGMDETALHVFHWDEEGGWRRVRGQERHEAGINRVQGLILESGTHAIGWQREYYLPLLLRNS